jgi:hypothetical protein
VGGMSDVRSAEHGVSQAPDCDNTPSARELGEEHPAAFDLGRRRAPIRVRAAREMRMRRHQVPEKDVLLQTQVGQDAMDDRCGRLAGRTARQLALGRERDAAYARAAITGCLADEKETRRTPAFEVTLQALTSDLGARPATVEVECVADVSGGQARDEVTGRPHRA